MLELLRNAARTLNFVLTAPYRAFRFLLGGVFLNPRLGRFRLILAPVVLYIVFALVLVYVYAPLRGITGRVWMSKALEYANERSLGTAVFDARRRFVGIFDPVLDSEEDVNYTGRPIELPEYIAYPDHKSLHVSTVPEDYWRCLVHHEDRHIGGVLNPFGIDLLGVLKIPTSTVQRSIRDRRPRLGAGGSTLSMQLARIFFKTPPSPNESVVDKLKRKLKEWWLAPVIHWELVVRGDELDGIKRWAANHLPLAQRTGSQALYGVEQTSLIVFGKPSEDLDTAEQYVLAAAVNQPIILLEGSDRLNAVRRASWKRIVGNRARHCANALLDDPARRDRVTAALARLAARPPDPKMPPAFSHAIAAGTPTAAGPAAASPIRRSNALIPAAKYGVREQLKSRFGFGWRARVRDVTISLDTAQNLAFRRRVQAALARMQSRFRAGVSPHYSMDVGAARAAGLGPLKVPDVVVAAADRNGALVRYFETNFNAAYFGSPLARETTSGRYDPSREGRAIASVAKMAAAVAIANDGGDTPASAYLDTRAPEIGLEICKRGRERRLRRADVAFACSLNAPIEWRLRKIASSDLRRLADGFALVRRDLDAPLAKSLVIGHMAASPRTVHHMAGIVLGALAGQGRRPVPAPSLVVELDEAPSAGAATIRPEPAAVRPAALIKPEGHALLRALLSAPLCHPHGTLRRLSDWCAGRKADVRLHFAKTGTRGTGTPDRSADDTVDLWVAGGIQFANGAAFSYVILIGTGSPSRPWARDLYAGTVTQPLLRVLLEDLAKISERRGRTAGALPRLAGSRNRPR